MEGEDDCDRLVEDVLQSLVVATRASNAMSQDFEYRSTFGDFRDATSDASQRAVGLLTALHSHLHEDPSEEHLAELLWDATDLDVSDPATFQPCADLVDELLEEADGFLGAEEGVSRLQPTSIASLSRRYASKASSSLSDMVKAPKPQASPGWTFAVDNTRHRPFLPRPWDNRPSAHHEHPFRAELESLEFTPAQLAAPRRPHKPAPLAVGDMTAQYPKGWRHVQTEEDLVQMVQMVREDLASDVRNGQFPAIAIDLEHHSFRSFQGLTCLLQLSSHGGDFVVDCLVPAVRASLGRALGDILSDPGVVKVLHGADSDVLWLQRDFGLYIVNLFDTFRAAQALDYPSKSLAYLLQRHAGVEDAMQMKQKYQMADWRKRPLSPEMLLYARSDTHFLLAIQQIMVQELHHAGGDQAILNVLVNSKSVASRVYEKEIFDPNGWRRAAARHGFQPVDTAAELRAKLLWDWRDLTARAQDEGPGFVLSAQLLFSLARRDPPASEAEVLQACRGGVHGNSGPPLVVADVSNVLACLRGDWQAPAHESIPASAEPAPPLIRRESLAVRSPFSFTPATSTAAIATPQRPGSAPQGSPSPVLNTEDLYRTAGWVSPSPLVPHPSIAEGANTPITMAVPRKSFGSVGNERGRPEPADQSYRTARDALVQQPFLPLVGEHQGDFLAALKTAEPQAPSVRSVSMGEGWGDGMGSRLVEEEANPGEGEPNPDNLVRTTDIPRSMSDIFKISNRNRRRNKEKKKLREAQQPEPTSLTKRGDGQDGSLSSDHTSSSMPEGFNYFEIRHKKPRPQQSAPEDDTLAFMHEIGWVDAKQQRELQQTMQGGADAEPGNQTHHQQRPRNGSRDSSGSGGGGSSSGAGESGNTVSSVLLSAMSSPSIGVFADLGGSAVAAPGGAGSRKAASTAPPGARNSKGSGRGGGRASSSGSLSNPYL